MENIFKKMRLFLEVACVVTPVLSLIGLIVVLFTAPSGSSLVLILMGATIIPGGIAYILYGHHPYGAVIYKNCMDNRYHRNNR